MKTPRTNRTTLTRFALIAIAAAIAIPAAPASANAPDGPVQAEAAKKGKKKKRKKRKKKRPATPVAPTAPVIPLGCTDDAAEGDDSMETSSSLLFPAAGPWTRYRCPEDSDFFKIVVPARLWYRVDVDAADGLDHALGLYNAYGDHLETLDAAGPGGVESARMFGEQDAPDTWWVEVTSAGAAQQGAYTVTGYED